MGNEKSVPSNIKVDEVVNITEYWIQKSAIHLTINKKICVFEQSLSETNVDILHTFSKNLMLYRHPYILKYISSWQTNKFLYVATEYAKPLTAVIENLMPMQLCIGLYNIAKAITFLQEMAFSSHNNLSKDAVYVTCEGDWKLGRLELMTRKEKNKYLTDTVDNNYNNFVDFVDQCGFAGLALDILKKININQNEIPAVIEFKEFCSSHISTNVPNPHFYQQLLLHPFFNHQFVKIYNFLTELPLKNEAEKSIFFRSLADELRLFPEELVARQFGTLLLSRLVLLNTTAQEFILPKIFILKSEQNQSLFNKSILQKYISPRLLDLFSVRDSQIRLIILQYFSSLCAIFNKDELETRILPELLVGIKDTNELLVASTLHALADLVPVLGSTVVIGKGRTKLFADGRPLINKIKTDENESKLHSDLENTVINKCVVLTERPSPDGGEDITKEMELNKDSRFNVELDYDHLNFPRETEKPTTSCSQKSAVACVNTEDLSSLDVKCSRYSKCDLQHDDIELMFKTMEPIISKTEVFRVSDEINKNGDMNKFKAADIDLENLGGWDDEISSWVDTEELNQ